MEPPICIGFGMGSSVGLGIGVYICVCIGIHFALAWLLALNWRLPIHFGIRIGVEATRPRVFGIRPT